MSYSAPKGNSLIYTLIYMFFQLNKIGNAWAIFEQKISIVNKTNKIISKITAVIMNS